MKVRFTIWRFMVAVALVAVFLAAGIRLGECLEETRRPALPAFFCSHSRESAPNPLAVEATRRGARQIAAARARGAGDGGGLEARTTVTATIPLPLRYDDPAFSPDQSRAVRFAAEAILDPGSSRDAFLFDVSERGDGWVVKVIRPARLRDDGMGFERGGFTTVVLDREYKVTRITPGE